MYLDKGFVRIQFHEEDFTRSFNADRVCVQLWNIRDCFEPTVVADQLCKRGSQIPFVSRLNVTTGFGRAVVPKHRGTGDLRLVAVALGGHVERTIGTDGHTLRIGRTVTVLVAQLPLPVNRVCSRGVIVDQLVQRARRVVHHPGVAVLIEVDTGGVLRPEVRTKVKVDDLLGVERPLFFRPHNLFNVWTPRSRLSGAAEFTRSVRNASKRLDLVGLPIRVINFVSFSVEEVHLVRGTEAKSLAAIDS